MRKLLSGFALWLALAGLGIAPAAYAAVSASDAKQVQSVVRAQLAAFAADDAERAFSFAAPELRQMFGTSALFMRMVRDSYPVVYRPASVTFLQPKPDQDVVLQPVHMTDAKGASWLAMYRVQRQADKSWRIAGCILVPNQSRTV